MTTRTPDLTALLGSRICHDLISPLGAIGNGVELLSMSGVAPGPEMSLISESVEHASARIRFFRIAYGAAADGQMLGRSEIAGVLRDLTRGSKLTIEWAPPGDVPRPVAKLVFLLIQCLETAMPHGGRVAVRCDDGQWSVTGQADTIRADAALWGCLSGDDAAAGELRASQVQFALAPLVAHEQNRTLTVTTHDDRIAVTL